MFLENFVNWITKFNSQVKNNFLSTHSFLIFIIFLFTKSILILYSKKHKNKTKNKKEISKKHNTETELIWKVRKINKPV